MMKTSLADRIDRDEDPIDAQLHKLGAAPERLPALRWPVRLGISWASGSTPVLLLLVIGIAMGPQALALLRPGVLSSIDPVVPVALAVLGAHVGLGVSWIRPSSALFASALIESLVCGALVAAGILLLQVPDVAAATRQSWLVAIAAGVCAALSAPRLDQRAGVDSPVRRLLGFDAALGIVAGGATLAWIRAGDPARAAAILGQSVVLAMLVAVAAWLLLRRTASDTEQRIFGVSSLLLVGGIADYLSLSALLSGLVAGLCWRVAGGPAAESIRRDVGYLSHPLAVLLLVMAGARVSSLPAAWTLAAAFVLLRTTGKLLGAWMTRRVMKSPLPHGLEWMLISPGALGVAFAMNTSRAAGTQADMLLWIVILATIGSQLLAGIGVERERAE